MTLATFTQKINLKYSASECQFLYKLFAEKKPDKLLWNNYVNRLLLGEPYQYILGEAYFYNHILSINDSVLIPRPETEELVDLIAKKHPQKTNILDWCTGSGCIALALNKIFPQAQITAVDIDINALDIAKRNAEKYQYPIEFIQDNLLNVANFYQQYDLIVCNPPYIHINDLVDEHVRKYEPKLALFTSDNVLEFYEAIINFSLKHLVNDGTLWLEINADYVGKYKLLFNDSWHVAWHKDLGNHIRFIEAKRA